MSAIYYPHTTPTLGPDDRCDRCQQRARVHVIMPAFDGIYLCSHHFNQHREHLEETALGIIDERRHDEFKAALESMGSA